MMNLHHYLSDDHLAEVIQTGSAQSFWDHVDSRGIGRPRLGAWLEERGVYCLAARADGDRCGEAGLVGPFCSRHLNRAREWFRAFDMNEAKRVGASMAGAESIDEARRLVSQARRVIDRDVDDLVYFWELEGHGLVKIGHSRRVDVRVAQFRSGRGCTFPEGVNPATGRLIGTTPGGAAMEKHLHEVHRKHRVIGEWFRLTSELAEEIGELITDDRAA